MTEEDLHLALQHEATLRQLVDHAGFQMLLIYIRERAQDKLNSISGPVSHETIYLQEYTKGEIAALMSLPPMLETWIEQLNITVKSLRQEIADKDEDDAGDLADDDASNDYPGGSAP